MFKQQLLCKKKLVCIIPQISHRISKLEHKNLIGTKKQCKELEDGLSLHIVSKDARVWNVCVRNKGKFKSSWVLREDTKKWSAQESEELAGTLKNTEKCSVRIFLSMLGIY